jgi:RND superfamily putative drug exporter
LVLLLSGTIISFLLADALTTEITFSNNPESKRASDLLEERLRGPDKANEIIIVRSDTLTVDDPAFQGYVTMLYDDMIALGGDIIEGATHYYQFGDESLVSADRHTTILPLVMAGTTDDASQNINQVHEVVHEADQTSGIQVLITGDASMGNDFTEIAEKDAQRGELFGIPLALIVLALVFGAIAAAVIPVILGVFSIIVALGATALVGQGFELTFFVTNMIIMMGLAVGIDYSLFILSRYREERRRGRDKIEAIGTAGATAGRTVLFSGMTVVLALLGMLIVPMTVFRSLAMGAILVVIAAVLASQTLLPAVLGLMGDKVNAFRIPLLRRGHPASAAEKGGGFWDRWTRGVMRHPVVALVVAAGLLIAATTPLLGINTGSAGVSALPDSSASKEGFLILDEQFSAGLITPAEIVIDGEIDSQSVQTAIGRLQAALESDPAFYGPFQVQVNSSEDLALLSAPVSGDYTSHEAIDAIRRLRSQHIPEAFSGVQADVLVTGATALNLDYFDMTDAYMPIVLAFVLGLSFLLLIVVFRSIVVPLKAIIMNLLSVGAAYGLLVLVFQKGVGAGILGFQQIDAIEAWVPLFLFCVLFGLSMDYHMFLLSRIREHFDGNGRNSDSVAFGLRSTGAIITGAALIMVAVFGAFASGDLVMFQQMGFGLAVAVFLDATIVRSVLVPAAMKLLGTRNWYLPRALQWLPRLRVERVEG